MGELITASLANFNTNVIAPLEQMQVNFNPIQEGTPSPDNVIPITGWTNINVFKAGKNLFDADSFFNGATMNVGSNRGTISYNSTTKKLTITSSITGNYSIVGGVQTNSHIPIFTTDTSVRFSYYIENAKPNSGNLLRCIIYLSDGTSRAGNYTYDSGYYVKDFVMTAETYITKIDFYASYTGEVTTGDVITFSNFQLEIINEVSSAPLPPNKYEPYNGTTMALTVSQESGINYGGYIDLKTGIVTETWYSIIADGVNVKANTAYVANSSDKFGAGIVYLKPSGMQDGYSTSSTVKCSTLPVIPVNQIAEVPHLQTISNGNQYVRFYLWKISDFDPVPSNLEIVAMTNAWLQEHPTQIVYKLKTPITYQASPQYLSTFRGENNIWSDTNGSVTVEYKAKGIDPLALRRQIILSSKKPKRLPRGYQEVEYLQSHGTEYIDIGITPYTGLGFKITYLTSNAFSNTQPNYGCLFGSRTSSQVSDLQITTFRSAGNASWKGTFRWGGTPVEGINAQMTRNAKATITFINNVYTGINDTPTTVSAYDWDNASNLTTIALFILHNQSDNTYVQSGSGCRIYSFQLYNGSTLYRDYVPCYATANGTPGMYEMITNTFFTNDGTGTFDLGPVI